MNFFKVFDHVVRMKLLFISTHKLFTPGETIITMEELDTKIVVVLSGVVQLMVVEADGTEFHRMVLYPGDSIGQNPSELYMTRAGQKIYVKSTSITDVITMKKIDLPDVL